MKEISVVILAAGLGKRMKSDLPKVITRTLDGPMILGVLEAAHTLEPARIIIVTGHKRELVENLVRSAPRGESVRFAFQEEQRGTGHAVHCAAADIENGPATVLILYGDTPLVKGETLRKFASAHRSSGAVLSILTVEASGDTLYGRIIRDSGGRILRVTEARDCTPEERSIKEVNSGMYLVERNFLVEAVSGLQNCNAQAEYYLTDIVQAAVERDMKVDAFTIGDENEVRGVNDYFDLAMVNGVLMEQRVAELLKAGVRIVDPDSLYVDGGVTIGSGTVIGPNVQLLGKTTIGSGCIIEGSAYVQDSSVSNGAHLKFCVRLEGATVGENASVGPFAHLRPEAVLEADVKVGNFVEIKKSVMRAGAKASHLTYLGDAEIGEDTNIGAGTITCNYDGYKKSKTVIGKRVFIGSNTSLVAPVKVNDDATIGAGSVITKDVEAGALGLTRSPLFLKPGWSKQKAATSKK